MKGRWTAKPYYAHVFNDAIVISTVNRGRSVVGLYYTFDRAIELENAKISEASVPGISNCFSIKSAGDGGNEDEGKVQYFRVNNVADVPKWMKQLQDVVDTIAVEQEAVKRNKRNSVKLIAGNICSAVSGGSEM